MDQTLRPDRKAIFDALRGVASKQGSVITAAQLRDIGLSDGRIRQWCRDGVLDRVARQVYSLHDDRRHRSEVWAAYLSVGTHSTVAGLTAVDLHDLASEPGKPIHLVVTGGRPRRQPGVCVHHTAALDPDEIVWVGGLPCTCVARTLLDVAAFVTPDKLDRLVDRAIELRKFDQLSMDSMIRRRSTFPGRARLLSALARLDHTAGHNHVEHERRVMAMIRASHLPPAVNNHRLGGFEVDVHWIGTRAIVEADGAQFHGTPAQIARDIAKTKALEAFGFRVMRISWHESTYDTDRTIERVDRFLQANLEPPVPGVPDELVLTTRPQVG